MNWRFFIAALFLLGAAALSPSRLSSEELPNEITLTLESALKRALNHNRQIINSQDNIIKAQFQVDIADSEFDLSSVPSGDVGFVGGGKAGEGTAYGGGFNFSKKLPYGTRVNAVPYVQKAHNKFHSTLRATITQPLLRGFGREYTYANLYGSQFNLRAVARTFYLAQCQLIFRTITSLYDVIKSKRSVVLSEESYLRVKKFYQAAMLKSKIGLSDSLDIYRAEIEMHQAEDALKAAVERLQESEDNLRDLLALPMDTVLKLDLPLAYIPHAIELNDALDIALDTRIEIDQANDQVCENRRQASLAKNRLWPELNFVFNYTNFGVEQEVFTETWRKRESNWGIGFTTSSDFNPVADRAAYEQSLLAIEIATRNVDQAISNVTFDVKRTMRHLERTLQRIDIQAKQIQTAEGELRLAQIKFDRGMGNNFDLIQAEKALRSAQLSYWHALVDHIVGEYQLKGALGTLMEKPLL